MEDEPATPLSPAPPETVKPIRYRRVIVTALILGGILAIAAGSASLVWLASPNIGIGPFTKIEGGGLAEPLLVIRRMAFLTIILGTVCVLFGAFYPRQRWR
ncbi:MAG: hypothetical protein ABIS50_06370 [Luteolibacter sp.]|uniref:hypothetical protein n=1 Tax=Luteolibacter sp. TaxID=1962973 RepID=UPI003264910E